MRALAIVLVLGCGGPSAAPVTPPTPRSDARDGVALRFGCTIVTERELADETARLRRTDRSITEPQARERVRRRALVRRLAEELHIGVGPDDVTRALERIQMQNGLDEAALRAAVREQGLDWAAYVDGVRSQLVELRVKILLVRIGEEDVLAEAARSGVDSEAARAALFERAGEAALAEAARRLERVRIVADVGGCREIAPE